MGVVDGAGAVSAAGPRLRWRAQPDGLTCGPTGIACLYDALTAGRSRLDVGHLAAMCGTDSTKGTTHEDVAVAFAGLGIEATRSLGMPGATRTLVGCAEAGDYALCRTLTYGAKHWTLVDGYDGDPRRMRMRYLDPWLGEGSRSVREIVALVAPREFEVWAVPSRQSPPLVEVGPLLREGATTAERKAGIRGAVALCEPEFGKYVGHLASYLDYFTDWDASRAVRVDGVVAGVYLLKAGGMDVPRDAMERYEGLDGVEGVALAVAGDVRGRGYGRLLRDEPRRMGFDYAWGKQVKALENLPMWLRHRELVHDSGGYWVTARAFDDVPKFGPRP